MMYIVETAKSVHGLDSELPQISERIKRHRGITRQTTSVAMSSKKAACTPPVPSKNKTMPSAAVPKAEALLRRNKNKTKQHYGHQKERRKTVSSGDRLRESRPI